MVLLFGVIGLPLAVAEEPDELAVPQIQIEVVDGYAFFGMSRLDSKLVYKVEVSGDLLEWWFGSAAGDESAPPPIPSMELIKKLRRGAKGGKIAVVPIDKSEGGRAEFYRVRVSRE